MNDASRSPFLFRVLADDLEAMILRGAYRAGERLPSVRVLCAERQLSLGTVVQAIGELEARGLVEARPRSGTFVKVRNVFTAPTSSSGSTRSRPVPLQHLVEAFVEASGDKTLIPLGGTVLAQELLPVRHLQRIGRELLSKDQDVLCKYGPPSGDVELRRCVSKRLVALGMRALVDDIVITSGAMSAMRLAISVTTRPGEVVAVESPTFFALLPMLRDAGLRVVEIATSARVGIDLDALASLATRKAFSAVIVTPNFHNPTGACLSKERRLALLTLARRHRFTVIEDDVYGDLYFGDRRPSPVAALVKEGDDVLYCSSFSKTLAPGLRVGFVVGARRRDDLVRAQRSNTISAPLLNQRIIAGFLRDGAYERHLRRLRTALRRQVAATTQSLARHFPKGTQVTSPTGGFALWIRLPDKQSGLSLYETAFQRGIAILPGHAFAIDDRYADHIRISCGHPWSQRLEGAVQTLGSLLEASPASRARVRPKART
jgi:DNA-binding transcriptional MocR family regulator